MNFPSNPSCYGGATESSIMNKGNFIFASLNQFFNRFNIFLLESISFNIKSMF